MTAFDFSPFVCILFSFVFEILMYVMSIYIKKPPSELKQLNDDLYNTKLDVMGIKSIQLELVKHSKLTRRVIKLEKQIETITEAQIPIVDKWMYILNVARIIIFSVVGILLCQYQSIVFAPSQMVWPISMFFQGNVFSMHPVVLLFIAGMSWQYIFATLFV